MKRACRICDIEKVTENGDFAVRNLRPYSAKQNAIGGASRTRNKKAA